MIRKKIRWIALGLLLLVVAVCGYTIYMARSAPTWYRPPASPQEIRDAANRADQKFSQLFNWASDVQAQMMRRKIGSIAPDEKPIGPFAITLTDDELNSFVQSWQGAEPSPIQEKLAKYFTGGRLALQDGQIIFAANSTAYGMLASAAFVPEIDTTGDLRLRLGRLAVGRLPIPRSAMSGEIDRVKGVLQSHLPAYQRAARIDETFAANGYAAAANFTGMMLHSLGDEPSPAVVMIPFNLQHPQSSLPVKISRASVQGNSIALELAPMTPVEESAAMDRIKSPVP